MSKFRSLVAAFSVTLCVPFSSCEYDDSEIWERVDDLLVRVQKLETSCEQQNSNITALQTMMNGIKDNVYVTSVVELENKSGYSLEFSTGEKVEIFHGKNGENGSTPSINIIKENGNYYWSVNGVILKDETGNNIPVGGSNESPSLKTGYQLESDNVEGTWNKESIYVSVDNTTWTEITTGASNQIFTSVETSENNQTVNITLSDGSIISLPMTNKILNLLYGEWKKFDFSDGYDYGDYIVFEEDGTAKMSSGDYDEDWMVGKFRFIPDKYITCIFEYDESQYDIVWDIVEITETSLVLLGNDDDSCGTYTRVNSEK